MHSWKNSETSTSSKENLGEESRERNPEVEG